MANTRKPFAKLAAALGRAINEVQEAAAANPPQPQFTTRSSLTMVAHSNAPWATLDPHGNLLTLNQELMEQYAAQGDSIARVALAIQAHTRKEIAQ